MVTLEKLLCKVCICLWKMALGQIKCSHYKYMNVAYSTEIIVHNLFLDDRYNLQFNYYLLLI